MVAYIPDMWLDRARQFWAPLTLVLCSGLVIALVLLRAPSAIRAVAVLVYIATVPGLACVRLMRLPDRLDEFLLGVGLSLALSMIVAMAMIYAHLWSPTFGVATLVAIAMIAAAVDLFRRWLSLRMDRRPA